MYARPGKLETPTLGVLRTKLLPLRFALTARNLTRLQTGVLRRKLLPIRFAPTARNLTRLQNGVLRGVSQVKFETPPSSAFDLLDRAKPEGPFRR